MGARGEVRFRVVADKDPAQKALAELENQVNKLGQNFAGSLGPAGDILGKLGPAGLAAAAGVGAIATAAGLAGAVLADSTKKAVAYGGAIQDFVDSSEIGAVALQRLAVQGLSSSTSLDSITASSKKLQLALAKSPELFDQLGLSADKLVKMKPDEALLKTAAAIKELGTQSERTAASNALLGRGFDQKFLKALDPAVADRGEKLGQVMSADMVSGLDAVGDEASMLSATWEHLLLNLGATIATTPEVAEALKDITDGVGELSQWVLQNKDTIQSWAAALVTEARLVVQAIEAVVSAASQLPGAGAVKAAGSYVFGGGLDRDLVGHEAYDAWKNPHSGAGSKNPLDILASGWSSQADLAAHGTGKGLAVGDTTKKSKPTFDPDKAAKAAKAAREAETAAEKASKAQLAMVQGMDQAAERMEAWFASITGPGADQVEHQAEDIGNFIARAGGKAAFTEQQVEGLRKKLAQLREQSPEGFNTANEKSGGLLGNVMLKVTEEAPQAIDGIKEAKLCTDEWAGAMGDVAGALEQIYGLTAGGIKGELVSLAGGAAGVLSGLTNYRKQIAANEANGVSGLTKGQKLQGGVNAAMGALNIYESQKHNLSAGSGALHGAEQGAAAGSSFGAVGIVVGGIVGAGIGLFAGSKFRDEAKKAGRVLGQTLSKEAVEQIEGLSKKLHISIESASLLSISGAMADSGKDPRTYSASIIKLLDGIKDGSVPATEGLEELAKDFGAVADAAMKAGSVGDRAMVSIIKAARANGTDSPEIKAFVAEQLQGAAGGVGGMVAGLKLNTADDAKAQGTIFATTFWATVGEMGILPAADAFKDTFAQLKDNLSAGGFDISGILDPIEQVIGLSGNEVFRGAADGANALKQALDGVANAGYLTHDSFEAFEEQAKTAFDQAVAGGATTVQAYKTIAPLLQDIQSTAGNYSENLNEQTLALIQQAKEAGVAFKSDPIDRMADSLDRAVIALEKMANITHSVADGMNSIGGAARSFGGPPGSESDIPGYADSGWVQPQVGGKIIRAAEANEPEFVGNRSAVMREAARMGGGGGNVMSFGDIHLHQQPGEDGEQLARRFIDTIRNSVELQQVVRDA